MWPSHPGTVVPHMAENLAVCAKFETGETKLQRIKTVGVVSAVGDEFSFTRAGLNGTDTGDRRFPIGQWGLDDLIVSQAPNAVLTLPSPPKEGHSAILSGAGFRLSVNKMVRPVGRLSEAIRQLVKLGLKVKK